MALRNDGNNYKNKSYICPDGHRTERYDVTSTSSDVKTDTVNRPLGTWLLLCVKQSWRRDLEEGIVYSVGKKTFVLPRTT